MALLVPYRVHEKTTAAFGGTGTVDLNGVPASPAGRVGFVAGVGNGNECIYLIDDGAGNWEIGRGTVTDAATDTLSRDNVYESSAAGAKVNFPAGIKDVIAINTQAFMTEPDGTMALEVLATSGHLVSAGSPRNNGIWNLIQEQVFTGAGTVDFEQSMDGTYDRHWFEIFNLTPDTDPSPGFIMRLKKGGSYISTAEYRYAVEWTRSDHTSPGTLASQGNNEIHWTGTVGGNNSEGLFGDIYLHNPPDETDLWHMFEGRIVWADGSNRAGIAHGAGWYRDTPGSVVALEGVRFMFSSSNLSGTIRHWGMRK
jgi:hypothetical protein